MHIEHINYSDNFYHSPTTLKGVLFYKNKSAQNQPAVIVVHDWTGRNDFALKKAESLAELGYVSFAVDMYGEGKCGETDEEKLALLKSLTANRLLTLNRMQAALSTLLNLKTVSINNLKIGVIGFCLGGLCALDLARSGADIAGIVSFHGIFTPPENADNLNTAKKIKAKILALHGYDDPMVTPAHVMAFSDEMTQRHADWQIHMYGNTTHAFTNPQAQDANSGKFYNPAADQRSWQAMKNFLAEIF